MLRPPKEISEFVISSKGCVLDVGLQPQHIAQAGFGEPDDVVVLVLGPGDVAKLGVAGHDSPYAYRLSTPEFLSQNDRQPLRSRATVAVRFRLPETRKDQRLPPPRPSPGRAICGVTRMTMRGGLAVSATRLVWLQPWRGDARGHRGALERLTDT